MRYCLLDGTTIVYSETLKVANIFNINDYEYLYEKRSKYICPNARELAETYPGAKSYLKEELKEEQLWLKGLSSPSYEYEIKQHTSGCRYSYNKERDVNVAKITHHQNQIQKSKERIKKLENILYFMGHHKLLAGDMTQQIIMAKQVPITSFHQFNTMNFAKCPFHNESNNSLKYYPTSNTWYCFGCNTGGDSIAFIMKLHNLKFLDAVKFLIK